MADPTNDRVRDIERLAKEMHERGVGTSIYRTSTVAALCRRVLDLEAENKAAENKIEALRRHRDLYRALLDAGEATISVVEAERDNLREFLGRCISEWAWGNSVDGGYVQSEALRLGLIVEQTDHNPFQCGESCPCDGSTRLYWLAWSPEGQAIRKQQTGEEAGS